MEVHHHSHTTDAGLRRGRKWMHYFWEFLMLFLAVFCGFLAEYQLEHKIEKDREKQYVQSLIEDLQNDTTEFNIRISRGALRIRGYDSLASCCFSYRNTDSINREMYRLRNLYALSIGLAAFEQRTLNQLKFAGGMRMIFNDEAADSIAKYTLYTETVVAQGNDYSEQWQDMYYLGHQIFQEKYSQWDYKNQVRASLDSFSSFTLLKPDAYLVSVYGNKVSSLIGSYSNYINKLNTAKQKATQLLITLKEKYHTK